MDGDIQTSKIYHESIEEISSAGIESISQSYEIQQFKKLSQLLHDHCAKIRDENQDKPLSRQDLAVIYHLELCAQEIIEQRNSNIESIFEDSSLGELEKKSAIREQIFLADCILSAIQIEGRFGGTLPFHNVEHSLDVSTKAFELVQGWREDQYPRDFSVLIANIGWRHDAFMTYKEDHTYERISNLEENSSESVSRIMHIKSLQIAESRIRELYGEQVQLLFGDDPIITSDHIFWVTEGINATIPTFDLATLSVRNGAEFRQIPSDMNERQTWFEGDRNTLVRMHKEFFEELSDHELREFYRRLPALAIGLADLGSSLCDQTIDDWLYNQGTSLKAEMDPENFERVLNNDKEAIDAHLIFMKSQGRFSQGRAFFVERGFLWPLEGYINVIKERWGADSIEWINSNQFRINLVHLYGAEDGLSINRNGVERFQSEVGEILKKVVTPEDKWEFMSQMIDRIQKRNGRERIPNRKEFMEWRQNISLNDFTCE